MDIEKIGVSPEDAKRIVLAIVGDTEFKDMNDGQRHPSLNDGVIKAILGAMGLNS